MRNYIYYILYFTHTNDTQISLLTNVEEEIVAQKHLKLQYTVYSIIMVIAEKSKLESKV